MATDSQRPKGRDNLSLLNVAIQVLTLAKEVSSITPAKAVFGSASLLLTMIRDTMINKRNYVELGLACADVCKALDRGTNGRREEELSRSVREAIEHLTTTVAAIQTKIVKQGKRNVLFRLFHAKNDKDMVATWGHDLNRILHIFNTELLIDNNTMLSNLHRVALEGQGGVLTQPHSTQARAPIGEAPPPPPRVCFGREKLIEEIVYLAEKLEPIALIGAGGIGKTSVALYSLHHDRIMKRFGDNRRFIRCDQFPVSVTNFLARLSKVIGAGIENPEDLTSLRPFLSSNEMLIILDNAESVLDPQGTYAQEIYAIVDELCQFRTICLCITSRITTVPRHCRRPVIPVLSMEAACDIFYNIYDGGGRSVIIDSLLQRLDFHALSITLLATIASHNLWGYDRLSKEWDMHRARVLRTDYNESLAATIELSLASPTFQKLGPDARDLLGVVAFFPQGIDEKNLDWFFSTTVPDRQNIFDKFCVLSLTYRSNGYVRMLAPLRDYLGPRDPNSSKFLDITKECYFTRLAFEVYCGKPGYDEARWMVSEDVNIEHLLDVFSSIDASSTKVWETCAYFMMHIYWHKQRLIVLGPKIKNLPENHPSKPKCLYWLGWLFDGVGNFLESKKLLHHALKLWKEQGDRFWVAQTLRNLSDANWGLGLYEEGVKEAKEALEIYEQLNDIPGKALSLRQLAWLWCGDKQLDKAEEPALQALDLFLGEGDQFEICKTYRALGEICDAKDEIEKAIKYYEAAIAAGRKWPGQMFRGHYYLALLFFRQGRLSEAHTHLQDAKSHIVNEEYSEARVMHLQAQIYYQGSQLDKAMSEGMSAADLLERLGAATDLKACRELLQKIQDEMNELGNCVASAP